MKELSREDLEKRIEILEKKVAELEKEVQPLIETLDAFKNYKRNVTLISV